MAQQCEVKRIQQNSAQAVVDQATTAYSQAKTDYLSCLGPEASSSAALAGIKPTIDKIQKEVDGIVFMERFIMSQLKRELNTDQRLSTLSDSVHQESENIQTEIDSLKTEIRTERRRFLDASPSVSPAVNGLYFTTQPDNKVLIAFISCFGAFLLFAGLLVLTNHLPGTYLDAMSMDERVKVVGTAWVLAIVLSYLGFFTFT